MNWAWLHDVLFWIQKSVSLFGVLIIAVGAIIALWRYILYLGKTKDVQDDGTYVNDIRLHLGRTLILGLEFIVAADLIGTTTTPDYYALGLLAIVVLIRTLLSYSINREITLLSK